MLGDKVKIITEEGEFEGIEVKRPDILKGDITVLKLDSGYNIGIDTARIKKKELVEKGKEKKAVTNELKQKKGLPNVTVLSFGGTISSKIDYNTGGVYADYTAEDFVKMCPELEGIANLKARKVMGIMSEDFDSKVWRRMAKACEEEIKSGADGIVITQGTDTLHFSTAALSFMVKPSIPIVFTASQRSIDRGSSDAFMNLICAVTAVAKFDGNFVMSCMHANSDDDYCYLIRGTKVRKMHTSRRNAFQPVNDTPVAEVYTDGTFKILREDYPKGQELEVKDKFEPKVAIVLAYPGADPGVIDYHVKHGIKGIVISATALGHVPTEGKSSFIPEIARARKAGIPVIIASQTLFGRVHPFVYSNLRKLSIELNCIFAEDMMPEVAYIKLGWLLGNKMDPKLMLENLAGEITDRSLY